MDLKGKIALVTGGSGDVGGAIARVLATAGVDVAISYAGNLIWSSKNGHPVKRLLPKENYSQKYLGFCIPKTNGDGDYYKTFRYT